MARTLEQLVTFTAENLETHRANIAAAKAQEESTLAALEAAKAQEQEAIVAGNEAAYTAAQQAVAYNQAKYNQLIRIPNTPFYTEEEFGAFVKERSIALGTETKPLYKELEEAFLVCVDIVNRINELYDKCNRAGANAYASIPNDPRVHGAYRNLNIFTEAIGGDIRKSFKENSSLHQDIKIAIKGAQNKIDA